MICHTEHFECWKIWRKIGFSEFRKLLQASLPFSCSRMMFGTSYLLGNCKIIKQYNIICQKMTISKTTLCWKTTQCSSRRIRNAITGCNKAASGEHLFFCSTKNFQECKKKRTSSLPPFCKYERNICFAVQKNTIKRI